MASFSPVGLHVDHFLRWTNTLSAYQRTCLFFKNQVKCHLFHGAFLDFHRRCWLCSSLGKLSLWHSEVPDLALPFCVELVSLSYG